ncbi:hypothetical protein FE392_07295 [Xenorhabdus sp. 12]|uniref:Peptidase M10 metallopeptidase domain-containing protein n=1 Tax=Xenorhabdus santafensis TaxID=2582833 RepID=A0ABU4S8N7_9GAMM|nr:hypothetical protein [Xenorhabdus sp. 12]MDX7987136.1 hypothetical protein [Xenorhabdus sp. 12]
MKEGKYMFNYIKILILFFLSAYCTTHVFAQPPTPPPGVGQLNSVFNSVVFGFDRDDRRYSAIRNYGTQLLYQIPDNLYVYYTYDRQTYRVNLTPLAEDAARFWDDVLSARGFRVRRAYTGGHSNFIIRTIPDFGDESMLALTAAPNTRALELAQIYFPSLISEAGMYIRRERNITPQVGEDLRRYLGEDPYTGFLILTYTTLLHEFGHALGLAHPEIAVDSRDNNRYLHPGAYNDFLSQAERFTVVRGNDNPAPPIMFMNAIDYFHYRWLQLRRRTITMRNIVASPNEMSILTRFLGDECTFINIPPRTIQTHAIPHPSRFVEEQSPDCSALRTFSPIDEMMTPIYQMMLFN